MQQPQHTRTHLQAWVVAQCTLASSKCSTPTHSLANTTLKRTQVNLHARSMSGVARGSQCPSGIGHS
eukprot:15005901-Alexandrium_andersonii.AAC.1